MALGSITKKKVCGGDGIPAELFQMLKDDAIQVLLEFIFVVAQPIKNLPAVQQVRV